MNDYQAQFRRLLRAHLRISRTPTYAPDDLDGLRAAFETYSDDLISFFQHAWHLKDWIRNDAGVPTSTREAVVGEAEKTDELLLCADIANGTKHLNLQNPRVGGKLSLAEFLRTSTPGVHKIEFFVDYGTGKRQYVRVAADEALAKWRSLLARHGLSE